MVFGGKLDIEIVGVVEDVFTDIRDAEPLALYMPMAQQAQPAANRALVFRAADDVGAARREVIAAVRQLDSRLQLPDGMTLDERLLRQMAPQQFGLFVLASLGLIALLLTGLGTYVLAETMAVMRTRELGSVLRSVRRARRSRFWCYGRVLCSSESGSVLGCCFPTSERT